METNSSLAPVPFFSRAILWISWVVTSTLAILLGFGWLFATAALMGAFIPNLDDDRLLTWMMFPTLALFLGVFQWVILRKYIRRAGWWVLATTAGLMAAIAVIGLINRDFPPSNLEGVELVFWTLIGLVAGLAQLPVLYRSIRWQVAWVLASTAGWLVLALFIGPDITDLVEMAAIGGIPALFTGLALVILLKRSPIQ